MILFGIILPSVITPHLRSPKLEIDSPLATSYSTPLRDRSFSWMLMPGQSPAGITVTHAPQSTVTSISIHSSGLCTALIPLRATFVRTVMPEIPVPRAVCSGHRVSACKGGLMHLVSEVPLQLPSSVLVRSLPTDPKGWRWSSSSHSSLANRTCRMTLIAVSSIFEGCLFLRSGLTLGSPVPDPAKGSPPGPARHSVSSSKLESTGCELGPLIAENSEL